MNGRRNDILDAKQMDALTELLQQGSRMASTSLAQWIGKPSVVEIASLEQLPLEDAADLLGKDEEPMCFCTSEIHGALTGDLILAFDDTSGLALADLLLDQPVGESTDWTDISISAAMETTNILGCSYLNSMSTSFSRLGGAAELLPSPPRFSRDYAASLLEFALIGQAVSSNDIILARTRFEVAGTPSNWTLLLIPDAQSMAKLAILLSQGDPALKDDN